MFRTIGLAQCGIGILDAARNTFQRGNRVRTAVLRHQRPRQDRGGADIGPARLQQLAREPLGLGGLPHLQREHGAMQGLGLNRPTAGGRRRWRFCHMAFCER